MPPVTRWSERNTNGGRPHPWWRDRFGSKHVRDPRLTEATPEQKQAYRRDRERMQETIWDLRKITNSPARVRR